MKGPRLLSSARIGYVASRGIVAFCCLVAVLAWTSSVTAQVAPRAAIEIIPHIAARIHWIQYHMVSGRILAASPMVVPRMNVRSTSAQRGSRREDLMIEISAGLPNLRYEQTANDERLQIVLAGGNELSIQYSRPADHSAITFEQRAEGAIVLTLEEADTKRTWQASGFWQLMIAEPDVVRGQLVPLLEVLRPSWQLNAMGSQIEETLVERTVSIEQPDQQRWSTLVDELASPKFAARENAQRELYKAGQMILPFLQNLDRGRLDAEQAHRVRWLIESLSVDYEDKADRIVASLAADPQVWLSLLARDQPATRRVAARQLEAILGAPIDFDPDASEADRLEQLERLAGRLDKTKDGSR